MNKEFGGKRRYFLAGAVGLALGLGFATWRTRTTPATDTAVRDLWLANLEGLDGQPAAMQRYQGRPLLVNFWATWCPPCVEELPMIDAFYQENKDKVAVLGIAVDRLDAVKSFLGNWPVSFDIALAGMAGLRSPSLWVTPVAVYRSPFLFRLQGPSWSERLANCLKVTLTSMV